MIKITLYANNRTLGEFTEADFSSVAELLSETERTFYDCVRGVYSPDEYRMAVRSYLRGTGDNRGLSVYDEHVNIDYYYLYEEITVTDYVALELNRAKKKAYNKAKRASRTKVIKPKQTAGVTLEDLLGKK